MIYLHLFLTFFKIGLFTIGGGYAMIPMIQDEVVSNGWLTITQLVDFIAIGESTPGPFAVNVATYIGVETGGFFGAVCATLGVVMPSFLIILLVAKCFASFQNNRFVRGALSGLHPTVVGLIAAAAFSIGKSSLFPSCDFSSLTSFLQSINYIGIIVFALALLLMFWKKLHPILMILICAGMGIVLCSLRDLIQ